MPIDVLDEKWTSRKRIAWFEGSPPADAKTVFEDRGFEATSCSSQDLQDPAFLAGLAAVVFMQNPTKLRRITQDLTKNALRLLDYDCQVIVQSVEQPTLNGRQFILGAIDELSLWTVGLSPKEAKIRERWLPIGEGVLPLPFARIFANSVPWPSLANSIIEHPPGPAPNRNLVIDSNCEDQNSLAGHEILLRRAFWDCSEIHLAPMDDGRSNAKVYRAYGELEKGMHRRWPLPYFVKIDDRRKICVEFQNYEAYVDPYVPFHLGPHLIRERCCLGAHKGVIVGDYVEGSESLLHCARDGRAAPAIACLFDRTLDGWYRGAANEQNQSCELGKKLLRWFPRKIAPRRLARARELGATRSLEQLRALFVCCNSTPVFVGPIHGDLHARNVRVRASDAIVIDFFRHEFGPLVCDAASLEASLLIDGFADWSNGPWERAQGCGIVGVADACLTPVQIQLMDSDIREWLRSIESLYDHVPLQGTPPQPNPKNPACWFHTCVRQIRLYARRMESGDHQYAAALALALLTKATKDPNASEPEASRRAGAYVLAERILLNTFGK